MMHDCAWIILTLCICMQAHYAATLAHMKAKKDGEDAARFAELQIWNVSWIKLGSFTRHLSSTQMHMYEHAVVQSIAPVHGCTRMCMQFHMYTYVLAVSRIAPVHKWWTWTQIHDASIQLYAMCTHTHKQTNAHASAGLKASFQYANAHVCASPTHNNNWGGNQGILSHSFSCLILFSFLNNIRHACSPLWLLKKVHRRFDKYDTNLARIWVLPTCTWRNFSSTTSIYLAWIWVTRSRKKPSEYPWPESESYMKKTCTWRDLSNITNPNPSHKYVSTLNRPPERD